MGLSTLPEWLKKIGTIDPSTIKLGLERVGVMATRLGVKEPGCPVIMVAGTNGKGSTVAGLEAIYKAAGYHTGIFSTPILFKHNEQVRINGSDVGDEDFCDAFSQIELLRSGIELTPFEYHALAAFIILKKHDLDIWILEIGMGGRLDAVNVIDADISIVTSIGLDHTQWLGETREAIAKEKAGIFRKNKPAICGDNNPPNMLIDYANQIGAKLYLQGKDFSATINDCDWEWHDDKTTLATLPVPSLHIQNMSSVLMAIQLLQHALPVSRQAINKGLVTVALPGRIQVIPGSITRIYDVSHNPEAILLLTNYLKKTPGIGKTYALFSMLSDKDIPSCINNIKQQIDHWCVAPLNTKRAASEEQLRHSFQQAYVASVSYFDSISKANNHLKQLAKAGDRLVVFGSFHTVAALLQK